MSHSRGFSVVPAAITMTLASSVTDSPVAPTRQVTLFATVCPPAVVVPMFVANASAIRVTVRCSSRVVVGDAKPKVPSS